MSSDITIDNYARIACAVNLQNVLELLEEAWKFSVAMDMSTHMSTLYLGVYTRLHLNRHGIINPNLLVIIFQKRHMAAVIFATVENALDFIYPSWKDTVIGIPTEGERKTTGRISGVVMMFQNAAKPGFIFI